MPPLLAADGVSIAYGDFLAVEGVDLVVPEGALVALLGPNGAGKSTFLKAVAGLVPLKEGELRLRGSPLVGSGHERSARGVCLIPEGRGIFPALTVADNLKVALRGFEPAIERVVAYFPVLGQRMEQLAGTLSGGEQQMLALARAVGLRQELLLADELSLGLAPLLVRTIMDTLERLHREEGRAILLVEQYATQALRVADLVYILNRGQLVWAGEPAELRASKVLVESYLGAERTPAASSRRR
jgi:branched-chain amino acid transport system ATP-binding protein